MKTPHAPHGKLQPPRGPADLRHLPRILKALRIRAVKKPETRTVKYREAVESPMARVDLFARSRLHPRTEERRIDAYQSAGSDGEAARMLRLTHNTFSTWRIRRGLPAKHPRPGDPVLSKTEHRRRLAAYRENDSDGDAAHALGMPRPAFRTWRDLQGLPAKTKRPAPIDEREDARRVHAYHATETDEEAAAQLGIGVGGFKWWRQRRGLQGKGTGGPIVPEDENERRRTAYDVTANDIEAAAHLGITQSGFQRWRAKAGLPAKTNNGGLHVTPREQARRMRAYRVGDTDEATAKRIGLKLATYRAWRQSQGLPAWRKPLLRRA